jgi:membrane associated rhomboid family serine protease
MLACPYCHKPLKRLNNPSTTIVKNPSGVNPKLDVCLDCGARSAPLSILEITLTPLTWRRLSSRIKNSRRTTDLHCPDCSSSLHELPFDILSTKQSIEICQRCRTAWFDYRELEHLPLQQNAEEHFLLPQEVREALNEIEIENGRIVANRSSFKLDARDFGLDWDQSRDSRPSGWMLLLGSLLIPVERENRIARAPWATFALITLVVVFSIFGFSSEALIDSLGVQGDDIARWSGLSLLTYFLVHGDWFHLLSNLYFLWLYGDNIEDELGWQMYLIILAAGTVGGALLHVFLAPEPNGILIGASGGISTLGMLYSMRFPRGKFAFFVLPLFRWVRVPAYLLMAVWIFTQLREAADQIEGLTRVSALCHLGGALVGLAAWFILSPQPHR